MGGGGGKSAPPAKYKSRDGLEFEDPNQAADRDRAIALASAMGYDSSKGTTYDQWLTGLDANTKKTYNEYNTQGLTAADYRAETRLKEQESQADKAEADRKAAIAKGRASVDTAFAPFDDNYYGGISKTVLDYYTPQLEDQYTDAQDQLTYRLARQGILKSDTAGDLRSKMKGDYDVQKGSVSNKAADAERQARENVSGAKSQLYSYADVAADPAAVDTRLGSETARIRSYAPELTPLGQIFTDYISPIVQTVGTGLGAEAAGYKGFGTGLFGSGSSKSSQTVRT
jgi:hypothetical protein